MLIPVGIGIKILFGDVANADANQNFLVDGCNPKPAIERQNPKHLKPLVKFNTNILRENINEKLVRDHNKFNLLDNFSRKTLTKHYIHRDITWVNLLENNNTSNFTDNRNLDSILTLRAGDQDQDPLIESILSKIPHSGYSKISFNKYFQKVISLLEPIANEKTVRILAYQPKAELLPSPVPFTEALVRPSTIPSRLRPMQSMTSQSQLQRAMATNNLDPSGLSKNHNQLSSADKLREQLTAKRRAEKLQSSQVLGDRFKYGDQQLDLKSGQRDHLPESMGNHTKAEKRNALFQQSEDTLASALGPRSRGIVHARGCRNEMEPAFNVGNPDTLIITSFEAHPFYDNYHFITSHPVSEAAFERFAQTGNIGLSKAEKAEQKLRLEQIKSTVAQNQANKKLFYDSLPKDALMGNAQLREVDTLKQQLNQNPNITLTTKQEKLLIRAERHEKHKTNFCNKHPEINKNDL